MDATTGTNGVSPVVKAVYDAAFAAYWRLDAECPADAQDIVAAALRALAGHMSRWNDNGPQDHWRPPGHVREELKAIAEELEQVERRHL